MRISGGPAKAAIALLPLLVASGLTAGCSSGAAPALPVSNSLSCGRVVDQDPATSKTYPLSGAQVVLRDATGRVLVRTTTDKSGRFSAGGQLLSTPGVHVIIGPASDGGGWMTGESYCQFAAAPVIVVDLKQGVDTDVGQVVLPRVAGQTNPKCVAG